MTLLRSSLRVVIATLVLALLPTPAALSAASSVSRSVVPLQFLASNGSGELRNGCTAWSLNQKQHYFVTAAHCVLRDGGVIEPAFIGGYRVEVVAVFQREDIAVLRAFAGAPALRVAKKGPKAGDVISVVGHPYGFPTLTEFIGSVISPVTEVASGRFFMLLDCSAAPGNSGSPVLNKQGHVVSILQVGWSNAGRLTGGAPYLTLHTILQPYTE